MQLQLFDNDGKYLCELDNDDSTLESYPIKDGYRVHVSTLSLTLDYVHAFVVHFVWIDYC